MSILTYDPTTGKPKKTTYSQTVVTLSPSIHDVKIKRINALPKTTTQEVISSLYTPNSQNNTIFKEFSELLELLCLENDDEFVDARSFDFAQLKLELLETDLSNSELETLQKVFCDWVETIGKDMTVNGFNTEVLRKCFERLKIALLYYSFLESSSSDDDIDKDVLEAFRPILLSSSLTNYLNRVFTDQFSKCFEDNITRDNTVPLYEIFRVVSLHTSLLDMLDFPHQFIKVSCEFNKIFNPDEFSKKISMPNLKEKLLNLMNNLFRDSNIKIFAKSYLKEEIDEFMCYFLDTVFEGDNIMALSELPGETKSKFFTCLMDRVGYQYQRLDSVVLLNTKCLLFYIASFTKIPEFQRQVMVIRAFEFLSSLIKSSEDIDDLKNLTYEVFWISIFNSIQQRHVMSSGAFQSFYDHVSNKSEFMDFIFYHYRDLFLDWIKKPRNTGFIESVVCSFNAISEFFDEYMLTGLRYYENTVQELLSPLHVSPPYEIRTIKKDSKLFIKKSEKLKCPKGLTKAMKEVKQKLSKDHKNVNFNSFYNFVEINYTLGDKTYEIRCNGFQATILMEFQDKDTLTFSELRDITGIETKQLSDSISTIEFQGILLTPNWNHVKPIPDDLQITINPAFKSKNDIIKIGL